MSVIAPKKWWRDVLETQRPKVNIDDDVDQRIPPTKAFMKHIEEVLFLQHRKRQLEAERNDKMQEIYSASERYERELRHIDRQIHTTATNLAEQERFAAMYIKQHTSIPVTVPDAADDDVRTEPITITATVPPTAAVWGDAET